MKKLLWFIFALGFVGGAVAMYKLLARRWETEVAKLNECSEKLTSSAVQLQQSVGSLQGQVAALENRPTA